jgi:hypothetical protein
LPPFFLSFFLWPLFYFFIILFSTAPTTIMTRPVEWWIHGNGHSYLYLFFLSTPHSALSVISWTHFKKSEIVVNDALMQNLRCMSTHHHRQESIGLP